MQFCPGSARYRQTYVEARRDFLQDTNSKLSKKDPLQFVFGVCDLCSRLSPVLEEEGVNQARGWVAEREGPARDQLAQLFDASLPQLSAVFKGRENSLAEVFSVAAQSHVRTEVAAYTELAAAQEAWNAKKPDLTAASLAKVPTDFRKAVYNSLQKNLDGFHDGLTAKLEAARKLAVQEDFLGANTMLLETKQHESWAPELREARMNIQRQGETFYAKKVVNSNVARQYKEAGEWLRKLLTLQGQKTDGIDFDALFKSGTTAEFLQTLAQVGLHPARPQERKDFTDVLLVVANLDNLTDPDAAHHFLANAYLEWASNQAEAHKFERACYLALLAQKHGHAAAAALFEKAHAEFMKQFTAAVSATPSKFVPKLAGSDMPEQLHTAATSPVRKNLPSWMRWEDPETPLDGPAPKVKVKFLATLSELTSTYEPKVRQVSREFPVEVVVDNPGYNEAMDNVQAAREAYERQVDTYNSLVEQANNGASTIASGPGPFAAAFANIDRAANAGILRSAKRDVENAKTELERAQVKLSQTPRQKKEKKQRTFTWEETDHITHFRAVYSIGLGVEDRVYWSRTVESQVNHKSVSRRGNDRIGLAPMERQQPELDRIQTVLANDMKPNIQAICASPDFVRQLKSTITRYLSDQNPRGEVEAQQDTILGAELAWWNTSLRDYKALADPVYLGRFGDVVAVP